MNDPKFPNRPLPKPPDIPPPPVFEEDGLPFWAILALIGILPVFILVVWLLT